MSRLDRKSDAQANAEALARRGLAHASEHARSVSDRWAGHREPKDLRECVHLVRQAYHDEVPMRLHEGPDSIGEGGTPKMDTRAEGYLFGDPRQGQERRDPETGQRPMLDYYRTPFRAALANLERQNPHRAAVVRHVSLGSMAPIEAAMLEGVPYWAARVVAEETLRSFLRTLSDVKITVTSEAKAA